MQKKKDEIPEEVIDYCIDNKVSLEEGLKSFIEKKLDTVEAGLANLKTEVQTAIDDKEAKISKQDMDDVESFLNFLNQQMYDND